MTSSDHIYIHVPFCSGKCAYCAFYSERFTPELCDNYLAGLNKELEMQYSSKSKPAPKTIYIGGGTPSVPDPERLRKLLTIISTHISTQNVDEWTVEANPGTLSPEKIHILLDAGVNRISLGAQSFDDDILQSIDRRHNATDTIETVEVLRKNGVTNISLDMIACLPGVNEQIWQTSLDQAIALEPEHISIYGLSIEPGSKFAREMANNTRQRPSDDLTIGALKQAADKLQCSGYNRYEISNYSRTGFECAHNVSCWRGEDYIGFGPGASSRSKLRRWTNKSNLSAYCNNLASDASPPRSKETVDAETDLTERLIFAFRLAEGVDLSSFQSRNDSVNECRTKILNRLVTEGLVSLIKDKWCLTEQGETFADLVAERLIP